MPIYDISSWSPESQTYSFQIYTHEPRIQHALTQGKYSLLNTKHKAAKGERRRKNDENELMTHNVIMGHSTEPGPALPLLQKRLTHNKANLQGPVDSIDRRLKSISWTQNHEWTKFEFTQSKVQA